MQTRLQLNILVVTTPAAGHVYPFLPLVAHLVEVGHRVAWYTGAAFQGRIEATGARFYPIQRAIDHSGMSKAEAFPDLEGLSGLQDFIGSWKQIFLDAAPLQMQDLMDILPYFPADVVLADETSFAAGLVRERTGIPYTVMSTSIYFYRSRDTAPLGLGLPPNDSLFGRVRNQMAALMADHVMLRELRAYADHIRRENGFKPLPGGVLQNVTVRPDLYLMATIPSFEYPRTDQIPNTHYIGSINQPTELDFPLPNWWDRLHDDSPVVHVTQGTVSNYSAGQLLLPALRGLADAGVLVVATTGGPSPDEIGLTDIPDNAIVTPFIPHDMLLPHVDVMITNGGYGGVQRALQHGVPLVISGATEEKPEVAARVQWSGAGIDLRALTPDPAKLAGAVQQILNSESYRQRAATLQAEFAAYDAPSMAARHIERLVSP